ncbi:MAG TPA: translocation/assembly module TamB domain-containing protein [Vicinamibacteria bacterium]|nr:translocation/assembly module TamB domain-containing protein [Vicinamibacteria bacterium]
MIRRRTVLLLLLLGLVYSLWRLPEWSARRAEAGLRTLLGRDARVASVRFRLWPFAVEITGLRIAGAAPEALPFLELERALLVPSLTPRLDGRVVFARVELERPIVRVNAWAQGGDDIPELARGAEGGVEVRVRRLQILDGALHVDHRRVPLVADLPDFEGRLLARRAGILAGSLRFSPGRLRIGKGPELPVGTELDLELDGPQVLVKQAHLRAKDTDLAYSGVVRLRGDPAVDVRLRGRLELGLLDRHVLQSGLGLAGAAHFDGRALLNRSQLHVTGRLVGTNGRFETVSVERFSTALEKDPRGLRLRGLEAELLGGSGRFDVDVPPAPGAARVRATLHGIDAEGALRAVFDWGDLQVASAASGELEVEWPRGWPRRISGKMGLDLARGADGRTPLEGRFEWSAQDGRQRVERADLRTPALQARIAGTIEADDRADLALDADSGDLEGADRLLARLRRALGQVAAAPAGIAGSGRFRGRWRGHTFDPLFDGRFSGTDIGYLGVDWGDAEWAGTLDAGEVRSHSLALRKGGAELWLDGRTETGPLGEEDGIEAQLRFRAWPASDFQEALQLDLALDANLSGEADLGGRRSAPFGSLRVSAGHGRFRGTEFRELEVRSELEGDRTQVSFGRAGVGGGTVVFRGSVTRDGVYDGLAEVQDVALDDVAPALPGGARLGGRVAGEARVQGPLARPRLDARFASPRLFLGDEGLGALELRLRSSGDGQAELEARLASARLDLTGEGRVAIAAPHAAALRLSLRDTSIDPYLRVLAPALPGAAAIVASGDLRLEGPLAEPDALEGEALVSSIELPLLDYPVRNAEPLLVRLKAGRIELSELRLVGEGTSLVVNGALGLRPSAPVSLQIQGDADLQALTAVTRRVRGRGAARLALAVEGSRETPRVAGRLEVERAGLRVRGIPQGIDDVRGVLRFDESTAVLEDVTGRFGGGELQLQGEVAYAQGVLRSFEVRGTGTALSLRYPEGLRAVFDADARLFGDAQTQWLAGAIDVRQARWTRRYDVASELLTASAPRVSPLPGASSLRYDLRLRAPGTLSVDNNLATLDARAELRLTGAADAPVLSGRAEVDRGRVYFQGNTYVIRRGTIDFINPQTIDPVFNIEAESRVRSYRVTLKMNGTLERVYPTLTSDPPLAAVQILNLLAGADESALSSLQTSQLDASRLAATGAATLAAGRISEEVGLERGAERLLGLSRFSIDPSVVRGGISDPTARLTVGKRVGRDLSVLYSVDLRSTDERLLSVEYTLSDRFSILVTQAVPGGAGLDVRLRHSK